MIVPGDEKLGGQHGHGCVPKTLGAKYCKQPPAAETGPLLWEGESGRGAFAQGRLGNKCRLIRHYSDRSAPCGPEAGWSQV